MSKRLLAAFLLAALGSGPLVAGGEASSPDFAALGREIVKIVDDNFLDADRARAWAERHADHAADIREARRFAQRTNEVLAELETSHTRYYLRGSAGYWGLLAIFSEYLEIDPVEYDSIGADVNDRGFVRRVMAGGPAEEAGLLRGDRILTVGDRPFDPIDTFAGHTDRSVRITIRRSADEPSRDLTVLPRRINPRTEWLESQDMGSKVVRRDDVAVGYVPLLWCVGEEVEDLMLELIGLRFSDADSLILDFRDGWGGCNPDFVNYFNAAVPDLALIDREGRRRGVDSQWRKPLQILINGGTRSGKEVIAWAVQRHGMGTLVGQRTAGFVVGGRPFLLSDGSLLYLAVMDARVDGERLEGVGVSPDVVVADALEYAAGADPQLDRAIDIAVETVATADSKADSPAGN